MAPRATGAGRVVVRVFSIPNVGATYQEVLAHSIRHAPPPTKPGGGGYI